MDPTTCPDGVLRMHGLVRTDRRRADGGPPALCCRGARARLAAVARGRHIAGGRTGTGRDRTTPAGPALLGARRLSASLLGPELLALVIRTLPGLVLLEPLLLTSVLLDTPLLSTLLLSTLLLDALLLSALLLDTLLLDTLLLDTLLLDTLRLGTLGVGPSLLLALHLGAHRLGADGRSAGLRRQRRCVAGLGRPRPAGGRRRADDLLGGTCCRAFRGPRIRGPNHRRGLPRRSGTDLPARQLSHRLRSGRRCGAFSGCRRSPLPQLAPGQRALRRRVRLGDRADRSLRRLAQGGLVRGEGAEALLFAASATLTPLLGLLRHPDLDTDRAC